MRSAATCAGRIIPAAESSSFPARLDERESSKQLSKTCSTLHAAGRRSARVHQARFQPPSSEGDHRGRGCYRETSGASLSTDQRAGAERQYHHLRTPETRKAASALGCLGFHLTVLEPSDEPELRHRHEWLTQDSEDRARALQSLRRTQEHRKTSPGVRRYRPPVRHRDGDDRPIAWPTPAEPRTAGDLSADPTEAWATYAN